MDEGKRGNPQKRCRKVTSESKSDKSQFYHVLPVWGLLSVYRNIEYPPAFNGKNCDCRSFSFFGQPKLHPIGIMHFFNHAPCPTPIREGCNESQNLLYIYQVSKAYLTKTRPKIPRYINIPPTLTSASRPHHL